jgi:hypothetical protein
MLTMTPRQILIKWIDAVNYADAIAGLYAGGAINHQIAHEAAVG